LVAERQKRNGNKVSFIGKALFARSNIVVVVVVVVVSATVSLSTFSFVYALVLRARS
jgi:hypothetical protein